MQRSQEALQQKDCEWKPDSVVPTSNKMTTTNLNQDLVLAAQTRLSVCTLDPINSMN